MHAVTSGVATDGNEGSHHLTGQAGEHRRGEAPRHPIPAPQVLVEGSQQESGARQSDREQHCGSGLGAEVAEGVLAEGVEAGDGGGGEEGGPNHDHSGHTRVLEEPMHHLVFEAT